MRWQLAYLRRATLIAEREIITMSALPRTRESKENYKFQSRHLITIYSNDIYDRRELSEIYCDRTW